MNYDEDLARNGYFVTKYEDRHFWDTPENLAVYNYGTRDGWKNYEKNPVLGGEYGTCFDLSVMQDEDKFKMWFSWRPRECIAYTESEDGLNWKVPVEVLRPDPLSDWDKDEDNRPSVIKKDGKYLMWYSAQLKPYTQEGISVVGYAESDDGLHWIRSQKPVMVPEQGWEKRSIMCPHVMYDEEAGKYKMWYSGGGNREPDAIGYAESLDGKEWKKHDENPVLQKELANPWERDKVTACHVLKHENYYYMFYVGFIHIDRAGIGLARSKDGINDWQRYPLNPIIAPEKNTWSDWAVYKPYVLRVGDKWMMWYNACMLLPDGKELALEQIGVAFLNRKDFWNQ